MGKLIPLRPDEPIDGDATVITTPAWATTTPPPDPDATVIAPVLAETTARTVHGTVPPPDIAHDIVQCTVSSPPGPAIDELFAPPPQLPPRAPAPPAAKARWSRRRRLMLVAAIVAGAWVTLQNARRAAPRGPTSGVLAVRPADATPPAPRLVPVDATSPPIAPIRPTDGVDAIVAGRLDDALPHYLRLAADHPGDATYAAVVELLVRELDARCRTERSTPCTPASP